MFKQLSHAKHQSQVIIAESVLARSPVGLCQALECCKEKKASSWLSAIPIEQHGFALHKIDFIDALCLRYGWSPSHLPSHCVCGKVFQFLMLLAVRTVPIPSSAITMYEI